MTAKTPELVFMIGIPGCGKSTFTERFLPYHYSINLDSIHGFLGQGSGFDSKNISLGRNLEKIMMEDRLNQGISIVIDNANIDVKTREKYFELARNFDAKIIAVYFTPDVNLAISQNSKRERKVPEVKIRKMAENYQMPSLNEGFEKIIDATNPRGLTGTKSAVFLDRDGVIFETRLNGKSYFINKPEDIRYIPTAIEGLKKMQDKGYELFVVSNQGGVALGIMSSETLSSINAKMTEDLAKEGVNLSGVYCCIHNPKGDCVCRKPNTGLIIGAAREHDIDVTRSYMIGDMTSDIEMGNRVKAKTILVKTGFGGTDGKYEAKPFYTASDLVDVALTLE